MIPLSKKAYTIILCVLGMFLLVTSSIYFGLLTWMSVNGMEPVGGAFQKLELFCVGNLTLLVGSVLKPLTQKPE